MCDIGNLYEILNFLTQDSLFTHQLPRAAEDAKPWMAESLPWLNGLTLSEVNRENVQERLRHYTEVLGESHELSPVPHATELHRDAIEEAEEMAPGRVISVLP